MNGEFAEFKRLIFAEVEYIVGVESIREIQLSSDRGQVILSASNLYNKGAPPATRECVLSGPRSNFKSTRNFS